MAEEKLAPGQFSVLIMVDKDPDQTQSSLAAKMNIERSTMVPIIDRLEAVGYVERGKKSSDRRAHAIRVTPEGKAVISRLKPRLHKIEKALDDLFEPRERERFIDALIKLNQLGRDLYRESR